MTQSLTTQSNTPNPAIRPWQPHSDTEAVLQAGEGQGAVASDAEGGFAGAGWAPPANITHEQEQALRSDLAAINALIRNGCDEDWCYDRLAELAASVATRRDVSEQEYGYKLKIMAQALSEYPATVVQSACQLYPRECKWFPELADIVAYADAELRPYKRDKARIERCLQARQHQAPKRQGWRPPTQADKDYARELVAGLKAQVAELDEAERKANRHAPSGIKPARRGLPEGPGQRAARLFREQGTTESQEASGDSSS